MRNRWTSTILFVFTALSTVGSLVFPPQFAVLAAANLTVTPLTWNVVGLDSNNVMIGPENFPVGVRVCNSGTTAATDLLVDFVWDDGLNDYNGNPYINLRAGSYSQLTEASLAGNNTCKDFYFEVTITRSANSYNKSRLYHINVTATGQAGTISSPTPREIYVERLVSQNRNSVLDIKLDGASIAAGGAMNLVVGNTYTIQLTSSTATNGYEQIETFINFPNTIFQILGVTTTYGANGGTDPNAGNKLYADGCGWVNDPTSPNYRKCSGVGKYGDTVVVTYTVKIISGGGTSQTLNTLIYDFSGSSYHYNSDFALSSRVANIIDPSTCTQTTIAQWTFNNVTTPSTGAGTLTTAGITAPAYVTATGNTTNPAIAYSGWDNTGSGSEYIQFAASTVGYNSIQFSFGGARAGNGAPTTATVLYSTNGTTFTAAAPTAALPTGSWTNFAPYNLSSIGPLDGNPNAAFRIYASGGSGGNQAGRSAYFDNVKISGCALPASINLDKIGTIDQTFAAPIDQVNAGDRINYTLVITNTGGVPLTGVTLVDDQAQSLTCTPSLAGLTLQPGQSTTCTGFRVLTQADFTNGSVTNVATADSAQTPPVSDSTTQTLPQTPALSLDKTASTAVFTSVGQQVTYTYALTNTGNVTLTAPYTVTDNKVAVDCTAAASPLLPGASTTCTATYTITSADIQAGSVTNTASATATFGNTTVTSNQDSVTINYAALNIIKEVSTDNITWDNTSVKVNVGATVYYRIRVQNTGTTTLTALTVDDGMLGCTLTRGADAPGDGDTNFEAGETWVYTCSVTAVEGIQNNTATADTNETEPVTDVASYYGENPSLNVVKTQTNNGPYGVGDTITYDIVVTNTGNVTLTGVTITDSSATVGLCTPTQPGILAPGATMTCAASHVVTQADIDAGSYVNVATGDSDQTPPDTDTVTVNFPANPSLSVVKTQSNAGPYAVGSTITYNIVVTNTGNITLTNVSVSDNSATVGACTPAQPSTLAPGAAMTCAASHVVTQADIDAGSYVNIATGDSDQTPPDTDTVTVPFAPNPSLNVVKTQSNAGPYIVGSTITYDIVVTNTGNVTLTGVTVTDNSATVGACTPAQPGILTPGAIMTCAASHVVTQADVDKGSYVNVATADSEQTPPDTDTVTVSFTPDPSLNVVKTQSNVGPYTVGSTITYDIVVTNTGNVTLTNVTVSDNSATVGSCTPAQPGTLTPGATMTCPATHVVTQSDIDAGSYVNVATGDSDQTPPDTDTVTVNFPAAPSLNVVKSETSNGPYAVGDTINYSIVVTNTGNITLTNVTATDNSATVGVCTPAQPSTLAPGASMNCAASHLVTQADIDNGTYVNIATGDSDQTPPDTDTVTVEFASEPALDVVKTQTSNGPYAEGATITYSIVVTNTGNVTLTGVTVTDNSATVGACTPAQASTLAPGATMTCPASHVVTKADLDNGSYVNTATADSDQTPPDTSVVTVDFSLADLRLVKTVSNSTPSASDIIDFTLTLTNYGPDAATNVEVKDQLPSGFTFISATASQGSYNVITHAWSVGNLALNAQATLTMKVLVNATGVYTNVAEVSAMLEIDPNSTPNNNVPTENDQDDATVTLKGDDGGTPNTPPVNNPPVAAGFFIPVTGFKQNVVTDLSNVPQEKYKSTGEVMVEIPNLSVKIPIVGVPKKNGTWNVAWLGNEAGWLEGTAFPTWSGNSVLTSHVYLANGLPGPFVNLGTLKFGDKIIVHAYGQKYTFEVQSNSIVEPNDRSVMKHEEKSWVTLITCKEFDEKTQTYKKRVVVRAVLTKVEWE